VNQLSIGLEGNSGVFLCRVWTERGPEQIWEETLLLLAKAYLQGWFSLAHKYKRKQNTQT